MLNRWLLLRFDALGALTVFLTTVMVLGSGMTAALGGVSLLEPFRSSLEASLTLLALDVPDAHPRISVGYDELVLGVSILVGGESFLRSRKLNSG